MLEPGEEFEFADVLYAVRLPELPVVVAPQEFSVPVARWVGLGLAAVRFADGIQYDDGYVVNDEVALLHRRDEQ